MYIYIYIYTYIYIYGISRLRVKLCGWKRSRHLRVSFSLFVLRECAATQNALGTSSVGAATKADDLQNAKRGF